VVRRLNAGLSLCIAVLSTCALGQDYARETRLSNEIVPAVVVGDPIYIQQTKGKDPAHKFLALFADAPSAKTAIVLVHGVGVHPDYGIIGALRQKLNDAGFATLSIQMPVAAADAKADDYYPALFDEAAHRIDLAGRWLQAKGYKQIVLLSHSMGAWMANEYLINTGASPYQAWICMGVTGRILSPGSVKLPTLDIYGENDLEPARRAAPLRRMMKLVMASGSEQVEVPGADHSYTGKENEAAAEVVRFIRTRGL
jgi:pimeloyl-ACP methyl ester carboxylesterase